MISIDSKKVKVILGEGSASSFKQCHHLFYNKNCSPSEVESLLVRPIDQSVKIFKASGQKAMTRSNAEFVKGRKNSTKNVPSYKVKIIKSNILGYKP